MIATLNVTSLPHLFCRFDFDWRSDFFPLLDIMASCAHGHILQAPSRTSEWRTAFEDISRFDPNITPSWWKTQTSRGVCLFWSWTPSSLVLSYFSKFSHPSVLLQVDFASNDESKTVCEGCYKTEDTSIFAWSSIPGIGHYHWLHGPICWLPPNGKADYLIRTIRRILDFLQLWIISVA
jgi:hypothetical protein